MKASASWGKTPRASIERECANRGKGAVVAGCIELLEGHDVDAELVLAVGGPPARWVVTGESPGPPYWWRVWALRGLLWAWGTRRCRPWRQHCTMTPGGFARWR